MLNNAPVQKLKHDGLTVEGYSRAAVQSYWRIPELKLGFDLGAHPWDFMGTPSLRPPRLVRGGGGCDGVGAHDEG